MQFYSSTNSNVEKIKRRTERHGAPLWFKKKGDVCRYLKEIGFHRNSSGEWEGDHQKVYVRKGRGGWNYNYI